MLSGSSQIRYFAIIDGFAPDPLAKPYGVCRIVESDGLLSPERFDRQTKEWVVVPGLAKFTSGGELGDREISKSKARDIVSGWGGRLDGERIQAIEDVAAFTQVNALLARALGRVLAPWKVSWPQALSLFVLAEQEGPISATQLVEQLGLGRTAMTSVVDRLERQGWVQRRPSTIDRRVADLILTSSGSKIVEDITPVVQQAVQNYFSGFTPQQLGKLRVGIESLTSRLRASVIASDMAKPELAGHPIGSAV